MKGRRWTIDSPNNDNRFRSGRGPITGCCIFCCLKIHIPLNRIKHTCKPQIAYLKKNKKEMPSPRYY